MFWKTDEPHGLPFNPFKSCIVPRPIGWISSINLRGDVNLAPYSFFNGACSKPPMVMFGCNGKQPHGLKDTIVNIEEVGEFVCNMPTFSLRHQMNQSSASVAPDINEFDYIGLETESSNIVSVPRVKAAPIHLECKYYKTLELPCEEPNARNAIITGHVVGINIRDNALKNGTINIENIQPLARMGYVDYTYVEKTFPIQRPKS